MNSARNIQNWSQKKPPQPHFIPSPRYTKKTIQTIPYPQQPQQTSRTSNSYSKNKPPAIIITSEMFENIQRERRAQNSKKQISQSRGRRHSFSYATPQNTTKLGVPQPGLNTTRTRQSAERNEFYEKSIISHTRSNSWGHQRGKRFDQDVLMEAKAKWGKSKNNGNNENIKVILEEEEAKEVGMESQDVRFFDKF